MNEKTWSITTLAAFSVVAPESIDSNQGACASFEIRFKKGAQARGEPGMRRGNQDYASKPLVDLCETL